MSIVGNAEVKCIICEKTSKQHIWVSNYISGLTELDFRPKKVRFTCNIMYCPHCGFAFHDISDINNFSEIGNFEEIKELVLSSYYKNCYGINFKSERAKKFYKNYLILQKLNKTNSSLNAIRNAVWACDDEQDSKRASKLRAIAIELIDEILADDCSNFENLELIKLDMLRRKGDFNKAITLYSGKTYCDSLNDKVLKFQLRKCRNRDDLAYDLSDMSDPFAVYKNIFRKTLRERICQVFSFKGRYKFLIPCVYIDGLFSLCFERSENKNKIKQYSGVFKDGYFVIRDNRILKAKNKSIYYLTEKGWVNERITIPSDDILYKRCVTYTRLKDPLESVMLADIPDDIVKKLSLDNMKHIELKF